MNQLRRLGSTGTVLGMASVMVLGVSATTSASSRESGPIGYQHATAAPAQHPSAHASTLPRVLTESFSRRFAVRPRTISYTGDGSAFLGRLPAAGRPRGRLKWDTWNRRRAKGHGTIWFKVCPVTCADHYYAAYKATVRLSRNRRGRFTRMVLRFRSHPTATRALKLEGSRMYGYVWGRA